MAQARGGVLFIDEAYALIGDSCRDFGHEAVATLLRELDRQDPPLVLVLAGYRHPLRQMMQRNPGLASRVRTALELEPLTAQQSGQVLLQLCARDDVVVDDGVLECWLDLDRTVGVIYERLMRDVIARRAAAERSRFALHVRDLAKVKLPLRADLERSALLSASRDDLIN